MLLFHVMIHLAIGESYISRDGVLLLVFYHHVVEVLHRSSDFLQGLGYEQ